MQVPPEQQTKDSKNKDPGGTDNEIRRTCTPPSRFFAHVFIPRFLMLRTEHRTSQPTDRTAAGYGQAHLRCRQEEWKNANPPQVLESLVPFLHEN